MTTYIMLGNWTDKGALSVKNSPRRLDDAKKALQKMGGEFKSFYLTMGNFDIILDLPLLRLISITNSCTKSSLCFTE